MLSPSARGRVSMHRSMLASGLTVCALILFGTTTLAAAECPGNPDALGTSRTIVVDPTEHPRLGSMQYRESLPLQDHEIVITFDDGPLPPRSTKVLETLAHECVKATYFMVGKMARNFPDMVLALRNDIAAGKILGPRMVVAGPILDGPKPVWPFSIPVANAADGRKAVDALKKRGVDFVKVYTKLPRDGFLAITAEARKLGLPVAGHVPEALSAAEASDAGQKSMEHLLGIPLACSSQEAELRKEVTEALSRLDKRAVAPLIGRMQARDTLPSLRRYCFNKVPSDDVVNNACGWAIERLTGEAMPAPSPVRRRAHVEWFLTPLD